MDGYTIYIKRQLWASAAIDADTLHKALEAEGRGELVEPKVNAQKLAAVVREFDSDGITPKDTQGLPILPGELQSAVKITETYKVGARKA